MEDNRKFAEKFRYPFKLLSDTKREMGVAYGAANAKDEKYAKRIAYLIDHGIIKQVYVVKDPAHHSEQVLEDVRKLT